MAIHVLIKFCRVGLQGFDAVVDDAAVGLMADHPRQILEGQPGLVQHRVQALGQGIHRKAEHRLAVHGDGGRAFPARPARMEDITAACSQRQRKGGICQPENGGSGPVAEQHAGGAVGGVHQAGKRFAPDDKGILPAQSRQHPPRHGHAIEKTGTGRVNVQRGPVFGQAQRRLHLTGHAGGGIRGRKGRADTAGNVRRGKAAAVKGLPRSRNGQRGGRFVLGTPVPGADAGAAGDPCVTGIHHAAQRVIGDRPSGKCPAGGDQL